MSIRAVVGRGRGEVKFEREARSDPNDRASRSPRTLRSNLTSPLSPLCTPATQANAATLNVQYLQLRKMESNFVCIQSELSRNQNKITRPS